MSPTVGVAPGPGAVGTVGKGVRGAFVGRGGTLSLSQGHIVSRRLWPMRAAPGSPAMPRKKNVLARVPSKRLLNHCQRAQRRSAVQCSRKKSGSFGAGGGGWNPPLKVGGGRAGGVF